ncbi:MAG: GntR family transcriptional regulator [Spirochaetales bacterium]|nr:GntR family transcriptional regulator [Spirochaetales bacterium]
MQYDNKPIYKQIAEYLYELILNGEWPDGERIPSIRDMAVQMEVNPNTMTRTYGLLQEQGIIYNRRGIGYFTIMDAREKTSSLKKAEFIHNELPEIFKKMDNLGMDTDEILALYDKYKN